MASLPPEALLERTGSGPCRRSESVSWQVASGMLGSVKTKMKALFDGAGSAPCAGSQTCTSGICGFGFESAAALRGKCRPLVVVALLLMVKSWIDGDRIFWQVVLLDDVRVVELVQLESPTQISA